MPLHVLQLGPYPPPEGGVSRNMLAIGDELRSAGHTCTYVATTQGAMEGDGVLRPRSAMGMLRTLAAARFDVLHLHVGGDVTPRVLALCAACAFVGRGRSVLTMHSGGFGESAAAEKAGHASFAGMIFRRFSRIVAVNAKLADVFRRFGVSDERVRVILPFALRRPETSVVVPADLLDFAAKHSPLLLAVGGLEKDYDPLFQIDAMTEILAQHPRAGLMIVGDGSMRAEVEAAASRLGENVKIAGNVEHAVTLHLIERADVLLRTTLFDGDAISVREALFLGTPIIATDNGMRPDGVHLIAVGDREAFIKAVSECVSAGRQMQPGEGDGNANIRAVLDLYGEIAG